MHARMAALYRLLSILVWCTSVSVTVLSRRNWTVIPGNLEDVTVSTNCLWGVFNRNVFWCRRPCNGSWVPLGGTRKLDQIDANDDEVWGVDHENQYWIYKRPVDNVDSSEDWKRVPGQLIHVSVSRKGYTWGVNHENETYMCKECDGKWEFIDHHIPLVQIEAGDDEVWAVNASNHIFRRPVNGTGDWITVPGRLRYVSASGNQHIWGLAPNDSVYKCEKPCTGDWQPVEGALKQIDGGYNYVCGVTRNNTILAMFVEEKSGMVS